jgi:phage shock protein C
MFCTQCGVELEPQHRYCNQCGKVTASGEPYSAPRRLERSMRDKKIAGVCAGVAHYFGVDVTLVRLIWVVLVFIPPSIGLIAYIVAWIVMPKGPDGIVPVQQPAPVRQA